MVAAKLDELLLASWQLRGIERVEAMQDLKLYVESLEDREFEAAVRGTVHKFLLKRLLGIGLPLHRQRIVLREE